MIRINTIRSFALAFAVAGASMFGAVGCTGQTDSGDPVDQQSDSLRRSHLVNVGSGAAGSDEFGQVPTVEHAYVVDHSPLHPTGAGQYMGPRPEPWMDKDDTAGPRPEPWGNDDDPNRPGIPTPDPPGGGSPANNKK